MVAGPAWDAVGSGAIEEDIGLFEVVIAFAVFSADGEGGVGLGGSGDGADGVIFADAASEDGASGEREEVTFAEVAGGGVLFER